MENKNSYQDQLRNSVDLILGSMGVEEDPQQSQKDDKNRIIYFFKTNKRKRKGQLVKFCKRYLGEEVTYRAEGITKSDLNEELIRLV